MKSKIKGIVKFIFFLLKINWIQTIRINFKTLDFKDAVKLPILILGRCQLFSLKGKVIFNCEVKFGTVVVGRDIDHHPYSTVKSKIQLKSNIVFNGPIVFSGGCNLTSWSGVIEFGKYVVVGSGSVFKCSNSIKIGDYTRITSGCNVMDTNVHFIIDFNSNSINNISGLINIGKFCWINSGTVITKGADIPDYSIVAQSSYVNRKFDNDSLKGGLFIAGAPAKVKNNNIQRVFSVEKEVFLKEKFKKENVKDISLKELVKEHVYVEEDKDFVNFFKLY